MFENKNFNIKEIVSVALIKPKENEDRIIHYSNKIPRNELIYKLSGEVITHFGGKVYQIKPGMVYVIPKSDYADYYIERTDPGSVSIYFLIRIFCLGKICFYLILEKIIKYKVCFKKYISFGLQNRVDTI